MVLLVIIHYLGTKLMWKKNTKLWMLKNKELKMRMKAPLPDQLTLPGDEPEPVPIVRDGPNSLPRQNTRVSTLVASQRMQEFLRKGLISRAVVSFVPKGSDLPDDAKYNPWNWGIVVEIDVFNSWPLRVKWTDGKNSWTDGSDLLVIHRGLTNQEVKQQVENETIVLH